jgi:thymidylate kinase
MIKNIVDPKGRGLFIILEGVDKAGKSTQSKMLTDYFKDTRKEPVECIAFPCILYLT